MAIEQAKYEFVEQKTDIRTHKLSKNDPNTGVSTVIRIIDTNNNGADKFDTVIVESGDISIFTKSEIMSAAKSVSNGRKYNPKLEREYFKPEKAGLIDAKSCSDVKAGKGSDGKDFQYTLGSIIRCIGAKPSEGSGGADKAPKKASTHTTRPHKANHASKHATKEPTPEPVISTAIDAEPAKEEKPTAPAPTAQSAASPTPSAASTTTSAPSPAASTNKAPAAPAAPAPSPAASAAPTPAAPAAPAPAQKPAAAIPPPPAPAAPPTPAAAPPANRAPIPPPPPQAVRYAPPPQQVYYSQPQAYTMINPASIMLGALGGIGLMTILGGGMFGGGLFGGGLFGGGLFGGGIGFDLFGGHGFHHSRHSDLFANAFTHYEYSGHGFHYQPHFGNYDGHYGSFGGFHHGFGGGGFGGGFGGHHGGFGHRFC